MLAKVGSKDTETVVNALIKHARKLPQELYKSLTWDRGKEMADHKRFTLATDIKVYFCDPQSPWQRGTNENTNGLLQAVSAQGHRPLERTHKPSSMRSRDDSTNGRGRRYTTKRPLNDFSKLLHRPVESKAMSSHWLAALNSRYRVPWLDPPSSTR